MKKLLLLSLCLVQLQCLYYLGDKCSDGLWEWKDHIGDYEFSEIPDMTVSVKDTLWINPSSYNRAYNACDYHFGDFYPDLAITDPEILMPVKVDNHFALVAKSTGTTNVRFIGNIRLRRNAEHIYITENMEMNVSVTQRTLFSKADTLKPDIKTNLAFSIESISIDKGRSDNDWIGLDFSKSPAMVNEDRDWGDISFVFSNSLNPDSAQVSTFEDDQGYDSFSLEMDSAYTYIIGSIEIFNENSSDEENRRTGRSFYIRSFPADVAVADRTFEVVYLN